jgi:hypothetical protein
VTALRSALLALVAAAVPLTLAGQGDVAGRLGGRVPPEVARAVQDIVAATAARGLPVEPLIDKAIEGGAKKVPADRVIAAVRALAARLDDARLALRQGGIETPEADVVEGGAYALSAGLSRGQTSELVRVSRSPYDPALSLRVAATLAALGVPPQETLDLMRGMMKAGRAPSDLLDLPGEVEAGVAQGATPAQAAEGLAQGAAHAPPGRSPDFTPPGQQKPPNPHKP